MKSVYVVRIEPVDTHLVCDQAGLTGRQLVQPHRSLLSKEIALGLMHGCGYLEIPGAFLDKGPAFAFAFRPGAPKLCGTQLALSSG